MVTMRTADGAPGVIEASKIATGAEDELRFEIHGEKGALRFNLMEPNWLEFCDMADRGCTAGRRARLEANRHRRPLRETRRLPQPQEHHRLGTRPHALPVQLPRRDRQGPARRAEPHARRRDAAAAGPDCEDGRLAGAIGRRSTIAQQFRCWRGLAMLTAEVPWGRLTFGRRYDEPRSRSSDSPCISSNVSCVRFITSPTRWGGWQVASSKTR